MAKVFEYKIGSITRESGERYDIEQSQAYLNEQGAEGWELTEVAMTPARYEANVIFEVFYFKREV